MKNQAGLFSALMAMALGAPSISYAQAAPEPSAPHSASEDNPVTLPAFGVSENPVDPYNASDSASAARTATKILDSAFSVYVITPALIQDLNPGSLFDVTNYFAGVSANRATGESGFNDRQTFRGIESFGITEDNFSRIFLTSGIGESNFNVLFMEHAELIMGPDAILQPTGTGGGSLNVITKSPQFTPGIDLAGDVGNYDSNKISVDATGPIGNGGHMAYRLIAGYQDSSSFTPGSYITDTLGAEFTYKFTDTAKFEFKYFGDQDRLGGTVALAALDGEEAYTANTVGGATLPNTPQPGFVYSGWNGDANWSDRFYRDNIFQGELTVALGEHLNMRLGAQYYNNTYDIMEGYPSPVLTETWNQQTGVETAVTPINPAAVPVLANRNKSDIFQYQAQNDLAGNYKVGGVNLQPLGGWAYTYCRSPYNVQANDAVPIATENLLANNNAFPLSQPPPPQNFTTLANYTKQEGKALQAYGYLRAGFFDDRLFATIGGGRTWAQINDYTLPYYVWNGVAAGNPNGAVTDKTFSNTLTAAAPSVQPWHDAYTAGLVGKVLPNVSLYYNYSSNNTLSQNAPLWQAGAQDEFGVKTTFFNDRLTITADHFQLKENDVSFGNPLFNIGQSTIPQILTNLTNHGEELNIMGGITPNLSVVASYTNMKLRDFVGRRQRNIPDNMANLLLDYHFNSGFLKNADVFGAVIHVGDFAGETVTGFTSLGVPELPGYYEKEYNVFNTGAGYKWGRYKFNLTIDNALNSKFFWQAQSRSSVPPYPGLTVIFSVKIHLL